MKRYVIIIIGALIASLLATTVYLYNRNVFLQKDRDIYKGNTTTLLQSVELYTTKDSLNAAAIGDLVLREKEFEKYRSRDADLIKTLQTSKRELQAVTTSQTETISKLNGSFKPKIIYLPGKDGATITDTVNCINISQKWFDFNGCIDKEKNFVGDFKSRDSLLIAVTVKHKRFLGFLWRTKKIKDRKIDVVSRNPGTKILGIEFIEIIK